MNRSTASAGALLLALVAALPACSLDPSPPEGVQFLEAVELAGVMGQQGRYYAGTAVVLRVRAIDHTSTPMSGETLRVTPLHGTVVAAAEVITDAEGVADVEMTATDGAFGVRVVADGDAEPLVLELSSEPRPQVRFEEDQVLLDAPGEQFNLFAQVLDTGGQLMGGASVDFALTTPGVVSLASPGTHTGTTSGMRVGVRADAVGETMLIATHRSTAADTAYITVAW